MSDRNHTTALARARRRHLLVVAARRLFTLALLLAVAGAAHAQYFGRNLVQWEDFDFHLLETAHFDVYHYPEDNRATTDAARMAERWYERLSRQFQHAFTDVKPIIFYNDKPDFQQTVLAGGLIGEGTGGFTEPLRSRLVMPLTGSYAETDHVVGHEMVHEFQFDIGRLLSNNPQVSALQRLPLWMVEGLAEYFSVGREHALTAMWLRDSVLHEELPSFRDLATDSRFFPYRYGHAFWAWVGGRWGDDTVRQLFVLSMARGPRAAFEEILGSPVDEVFEAWHSDVREAYEPIVAERQAEGGGTAPFERVLSRDVTRARLNLAPSVSPDGRWVAFLSTRDLFQLDLFLADAETGEVEAKLLSAEADPHFDVLRYLDSAGTWSPDGERFAVAVFAEGDNALVVVDVSKRRVAERFDVPGVEALSQPAWSPDGRTVAFSGVTRGVSDLWLLDVETGATRQLTDDLHADFHPSFSPDGGTIAFVSDRGPETDFERLVYSPLSVSLVDVESGAVRVLPLFTGVRHIDPAFTPDGTGLYFIAEPDGISNVYRHTFASGTTERVTNVATGVTGITAVSPALSVASRSGRLLFTVFEDAEYNVYGLDPAASGAPVPGVPPAPTPGATLDRTAAVLPPLAPEREAAVDAFLARATLGLPPAEDTLEREESAYDPKLGLEYIGSPGVGVFEDSTFGFGVSGGITALFSDILRRHQLGVTLEGGASSSDFGGNLAGQVTYINRTDRFNWGVTGAHLPFVDARRAAAPTVVDVGGQPVQGRVLRELREIVTVDRAGLIGQYPFSRHRRLEARATFSNIDFDREIETIVLVGNQIVDREIDDLGSPDALGLFEGSVAFVHDSSFYGFTSPVRGSRWRIEGGVTDGDLSFQTARADLRKYAFARPVTFAVRALHVGRYGDDAEDLRLSPLFVGRETLVRGYDVGSFDADECTVTEAGGCPEFDRLLGSRLGVVNLELRVPLFGNEEFGLVDLPWLPTELVGFVDAGVAWTDDASAEITFDEDTLERVPVVSAGVALRTVLGGYLPVQVYWASPFQREEDSTVGFVIAPGW